MRFASHPMHAAAVYDCADMRKAMPRDVHKESVVPLKRPVYPEDLEFD